MTLEASLESALTEEIGANFLNTFYLYLFLSINMIITCFCELDISPDLQELLKVIRHELNYRTPKSF